MRLVGCIIDGCSIGRPLAPSSLSRDTTHLIDVCAACIVALANSARGAKFDVARALHGATRSGGEGRAAVCLKLVEKG
mgnify:CR=1 FL=1